MNEAGIEDISRPAGAYTNPASNTIESVYRNIEDEPLIKKIKKLEERLGGLLGIPSVEQDIEEAAEELGDKPKMAKPDKQEADAEEREIMGELLEGFNRLLKAPYGALGYLVMSDPEEVKKLYGVDTMMDFYSMVGGSVIRISSTRMEGAVMASGHRFIGEEGMYLRNPSETPNNARLSDDAIKDIIAAINDRLDEDAE